MPEPFAAQAECGGVISAIFDLFTDTRLEAFAPDIAWGFVNSFHFTAGKLARREDSIAQELGDLARMPDLSEVYATSLEEKQLLCRSRSEEHTSELQSLMRISYAVFCLKKKTGLQRR